MTDQQADYPAYLASLYPNTTWEINRLTGGLVNSTVRATKTSGTAEYDSLILKHARPYIEIAGPDWQFSTERQVRLRPVIRPLEMETIDRHDTNANKRILQTVEAAVLSMWAEHGLLSELKKTTPPWTVPRLIRHDRGNESTLKLSGSDMEASVLVLADLGSLVNIVEFLKTVSKTPGIASEAQVATIGTTVGQSFALTHAQSTLDVIKSNAAVAKILTHSMASGVVYQAAIEPVQERLKGRPKAEKLFNRVSAEYLTPKYATRKCFSLGDFTPGTILLQSPKPGSDLTPAIVDWEFAQANGHGVNGDIAQFLASIRCDLLAGGDDAELFALMSQFTSAFCSGYREAAKIHVRKDAIDENLQIMRSSFILIGREIINQAFNLYKDNNHLEEMLTLGEWYIDTAGDDAEEFLHNWQEVEKENSRIVYSLFMI